ncbi:MAG: endonuclease mitochondrial [Acidobacteriota bacterium]|jgi:endonuclease G|nr:endonuclease mitochondrial [Acidobacteriota bacterium]MDT5263119.1 endonuclease mitochondrial [Acidobacteriota bacterium]
MKKLVLTSAALVCLLFMSATAWGQSPVPMASTTTYLEDFSTISTWANGFTSPTEATRFGSVAVNATGTIPDGKRITTSSATFSTGTSGGVQKGTQALVLLSTGTTDNTSSVAVDLFLDFTGVNAGTLSFDWATVNNSTGDRKGSMRVYTSTDGTTFTELTSAAVLNFTNNSLTSGSIVNVTLPASFNNSPTARIRFYYYNGTGGTTGSRPKLSLDNLKVTAASAGPASEPTVQASNITFSNVTATSMNVSWTNGNGTSRLVLAKQGSPVDAVPADGTSYTASATFGSGSELAPAAAPATTRTVATGRRGTVAPATTATRATMTLVATPSVIRTADAGTTLGAPAITSAGGNFVVFAGTGNSVTVTNLAPSTTYYFAVFEFNGSGSGTNYLTTNPAAGGQVTAAAFTINGTVRSRSGAGMSGITLTLSSGDTALANAVTDSNGNYSFSNVMAGGDYTVTPSSTSFTFSPPSATFTSLSGNQTADFTALPRIIISEFRFHGVDPDGAGAQTASANEFIELYNQTDENVTITGWTLRTSDGTTLLTLPAALINARGHYLVAGSSYGLASYAAADATLAADIPDGAGVALFNNNTTFNAGTRLDAAGFSGVGDPTYREGAGLTPAGGVTTDGETTFVRRLSSGFPADTDDNQIDFDLLSTDGGIYNSRQSVLGAPGPENTSSPIQRNSQVALGLLDPAVTSSQSPNRSRDLTSDPANNSQFGTMSIRRTLTNNTGANITRLRFRIINMTTYPSPSSYADLRARTSGPVTVTVTGGGSRSVQGTTLEEPPAQAAGGGLNSTLAAGTITLNAPLANGASVDLQFLLGVQQTGTFRFFVNVEAITQAPASASEHLTMGNPSNAVTDVNQPTNYLLDKPQYAVSYHRDRGIPNWVSWHLDPTWLGSAARQNDFRADTTLPAGWYQVQNTDYTGSGFDRGHHCPSADRTNTVASNSATFLMTNMMPQAPDNNQGPWEQLESYSRTLVSQGNELYIIAGGTGTGGTGSNGGTTNTVAGGHVTVPNVTWKVIIVLPQGTDDVNRVTASTRTIAIIMPNTQGIRNNTWQQYRVSVDQVEALTGFDFFSNVPVGIQASIESTVDNQ